MAGVPEDVIGDLIESWNDLNPADVAEYHSEPSPLEFMRHVSQNRPFVIRGGASQWKATRVWTADSLEETLQGHQVNVAVTPNGRADAPTASELVDGDNVFAKPHEEQQHFGELLEYLQRQELQGRQALDEVRYAQTQNDNFRHEYVSLFGDVQPEIPFASIALDKKPDAVNLWIGNSYSVTAPHRDPYENIYVQIIGQKHFLLLPGLCQPCMNEQLLRPATYVRGVGGKLELRLDDDGEEVPCATWDMENDEKNTTKFSTLVKPMRVTLKKGDMLYLPAMWYHRVEQRCSDEGTCVAANYWYDMEYSGPLYPFTNFVRNVYLLQRGHR